MFAGVPALQPSPAGVSFRRSTESRRQRCPGQELLQWQQAGRDSSFSWAPLTSAPQDRPLVRWNSRGPYPTCCTFSRPSSQISWHALPFTQPYRRAWPSTAGWEGSRWPVQILPICSPLRHSQRKTLEVIVLFSSSKGI